MTLDSNPPVFALDHLSCFPRPLISETFLKFYFFVTFSAFMGVHRTAWGVVSPLSRHGSGG